MLCLGFNDMFKRFHRFVDVCLCVIHFSFLYFHDNFKSFSSVFDACFCLLTWLILMFYDILKRFDSLCDAFFRFSCFFMFFCYWPPRDLLSRWTFCMLACLYICMDPKCLYASSSFSRCCWQRQPCFDHARNSHVIARYVDYDCKRCRLLGRRRCSHISAALFNLDSRNVQLKIPASRNYAWTTGREEGKESKCQDKEDRSHCCRVLRPYKLPPNLLGCGGLRSHCCRVLQPYKWPPSPLGCGGL